MQWWTLRAWHIRNNVCGLSDLRFLYIEQTHSLHPNMYMFFSIFSHQHPSIPLFLYIYSSIYIYRWNTQSHSRSVIAFQFINHSPVTFTHLYHNKILPYCLPYNLTLIYRMKIQFQTHRNCKSIYKYIFIMCVCMNMYKHRILHECLCGLSYKCFAWIIVPFWSRTITTW